VKTHEQHGGPHTEEPNYSIFQCTTPALLKNEINLHYFLGQKYNQTTTLVIVMGSIRRQRGCLAEFV
jgi:hypothetical protein